MTGYLRQRGHDVSTTPEEELCGAEDQAVFVSAAEEQRALVTLDLDFSNLIRLPPTGKGCHPSFRQMTTRGTVVKRTDKRKVAMRNVAPVGHLFQPNLMPQW